MTKEEISTSAAPAAVGAYSQAVAIGDWIFCSGQIALDPNGGGLVGDGDVRRETRQVLENLEGVLKAAGGSLASVVKATIYLADIDDFAAVNEVYGAAFSQQVAPARACVAVRALPKGARVEIDAVARRGA